MDNDLYLSICRELNSINKQYADNAIKHYQYIASYDSIFERYRVSRKLFLEEFEKRSKLTF